jgi:hypothetical protein
MTFRVSFQRLTIPMVDNFIADLKDAVEEAKSRPTGKGTMVSLYGTIPIDRLALLCTKDPSPGSQDSEIQVQLDQGWLDNWPRPF